MGKEHLRCMFMRLWNGFCIYPICYNSNIIFLIIYKVRNQYLHNQDKATVSNNWSYPCSFCLVSFSGSFARTGMSFGSPWEDVCSSHFGTVEVGWCPVSLCVDRTTMHCLIAGFPLMVLGLQLSRSYSSWAFCIFRFFILLLWKWKVVRETNIIPIITATKTMRAKVDEKAWKMRSTWAMQVPLLWFVPLKMQCGMDSINFSDVLALITVILGIVYIPWSW